MAGAAAAAPRLSKLQQQMKARLEGARFRFLNERLYTQRGAESLAMMREEPALFDAYHAGYRAQVSGWPRNPLDDIIAEVAAAPRTAVVADLGCGEARLAASVPQRVHSFDLVARAPGVVAVDIAHLPLADASVDIVVFCLSLMGTDFMDFLREATRVLRPGGRILVAEVRSRFASADKGADRGASSTKPVAGKKRRREDAAAPVADDADGVREFGRAVCELGYSISHMDVSNAMFVLMYFTKRGGGSRMAAAAGAGVKRRRGESASSSAAAPAEAGSDDEGSSEDDAPVDGGGVSGAAASRSRNQRRKASRRARWAATVAASDAPAASAAEPSPAPASEAKAGAGGGRVSGARSQEPLTLRPCFYKRR